MSTVGHTASTSLNKVDFIIDGVAHAYNHSPDNYVRKLTTVSGSYAYHLMGTPPEHRLTEHQWARDWQPEEFMDMMLLESSTDLICMHSVPLFDYAKDGLVSNEKGAYLKRTYPNRVLWYAALDLGEPPDRLLALLNQVIAEGADGIKLYPTGTNHQTGAHRDWAMDDERLAFPIFQHIQDRGIRHVAVHKLLEYDGVSIERKRFYGVSDIAQAAQTFPDLTFHLVHAGWTLIDETIVLMQKCENVVAVLEGPFYFPLIDVDRFEQFLKLFILGVGPDRMIYSSAATNPHPRFIIEAFEAYEPSPNAGFMLTREDRAKIMGGTFARLHGIDIDKRRVAIAEDRFSAYKQRHGLRQPWAGILEAGGRPEELTVHG